MRTVRMLLVATMVAVLPVSSGVVALGQSEAPPDLMGASFWTGSWTGTGGEPGQEVSGAGFTENLGGVAVGDVTADDPRMAGTMTQNNNHRYTASQDPEEGDVSILNGTVRIDNDEGAWVGTWTSYGGRPGGAEWYVMEGEGAYAGLSTVFLYRWEDSSFEGVILPAELPPLPDQVQPPAE